jgi:hypothetical protein
MVDGKTQLFADLMVYNLEVIAGGAFIVFLAFLGVLMLFTKWDLEEEPSD